MSLRPYMTFCWRRFRHFIAAYVALGLAATATHGAILFMSLDAVASDSEEPIVLSEEAPQPVEEIPTESAPEEPMTDAEEPTDEPPSEELVSEETAPEGEETAPATEEVSPDSSPEEPSETPVSEEPPTEEDVESPTEEPLPTPEEPAEVPISWPEERITDDEVTDSTEFTLPPYSEARSTIEGVMPQLDWIYTLRAEAPYIQISLAKISAQSDLTQLIDTLEANGTNAAINTRFCEVDAALSELITLLAPGSDDTQPNVDANNTAVINDINAAVSQVRDTWIAESGSNWSCN